MESSASPTTETPQIPKRRRRWWRIVSFGILAAMIVFGIYAITKPSLGQFRFLSQVKPIYDSGDIVPNFKGSKSYVRLVTYRLSEPFQEVLKSAREELVPAGWKEDKSDEVTTTFTTKSGDTAISVSKGDPVTTVLIHENRPASILDRIRFWCANSSPFKSSKRANAN